MRTPQLLLPIAVAVLITYSLSAEITKRPPVNECLTNKDCDTPAFTAKKMNGGCCGTYKHLKKDDDDNYITKPLNERDKVCIDREHY